MTTPDKPAIPAELVGRMVALIGRMAERAPRSMNLLDYSLASEIAEEFPKPVDPDLAEARSVCSDLGYIKDPTKPDGPVTMLVYQSYKRGRELAKAEYGERWEAIFGEGRYAPGLFNRNTYFDGKRHD